MVKELLLKHCKGRHPGIDWYCLPLQILACALHQLSSLFQKHVRTVQPGVFLKVAVYFPCFWKGKTTALRR